VHLPSFCDPQKDIVGVPYTFLYWRGRAARIVQGSNQDSRLVGPLNAAMVGMVVDAARDACCDPCDPGSEDFVIKVAFT